jgi:hypothetical protein
MANINHQWRRFMSVGCSHGHLIHPVARAKALAFKKAWKPHKTFDHGDVLDTAAFRSGAHGSKDECEYTQPDRFAARDWLLTYEPDVITWGNHEWRVFELSDHPNAIVSAAAQLVRDELLGIAKKLKAETRDYNIETGWYRWSDILYGHGYMFALGAIKDHARKFGRCVIAHLHRTGSEAAEQITPNVRCYCTGYLGDRTKFGYAHRRPAFLQWNWGIVYGEATDTKSVIWMAEGPRGPEDEWRLPL